MTADDRHDNTPAPDPGSDPGRSPRGLPRSVALLAAGVIALAIASIFFSMRGNGGDTGVLVDDDFSEAAEHWNLDSHQGITSSIEEGAYTVSLSETDLGFLDSVTFADATEYPAVRIESSVAFEQVADGANVGLACISNPGDGESLTGIFGRYEATIDLDGHAIVERFINSDTVTVEEVESPVRLDESGTNDLALECRFDNEIASIRLTLNGDEIIDVENETSLVGYEGAGMVANTMGAGLEVTFDHLTASSID